MKLGKVILLTAFVANLLFASETVLIKEMKNMRDGMNQINDGFFYHKKEKIIQGLKLVKDANKIFKTQADVKKYLPKKVKHMFGLSYSTAKKIDININKMEKLIKQDKFSKASDTYVNIIKSCTSCHTIVRDW
ncbi:MAG: hypothetical protein KAQ94_01450 [Arcobacteraceae bacterium]|nr:hypothetical protein [Arcobacteraceae bacterium]